jgi:two-component system response regulator HydG
MREVYKAIGRVAAQNVPVLITGESGTGKELVARSIHFSGPFRDKPFVAIDCGSLVPSLIESELFGYVKGAFTGAAKNKDGLLQSADGGTIFLDEIGELPVDLQSKLLRALQEKEVRPVGGTKPVAIDVRVLAATNRDLELAVDQGTFRKDLYFRLNVLSLRIPALRQRKQDIPLLVGHFLERLSRSTGIGRNISDDALKLMLSYDWPGNIRELENCIERACALTSGPTIHIADLPTTIQNWREQSEPAAEHLLMRHGIMPIAEMEKQAILGAIEMLHGDKLEAARLLGIGKTTLYRKLKEYGALQ